MVRSEIPTSTIEIRDIYVDRYDSILVLLKNGRLTVMGRLQPSRVSSSLPLIRLLGGSIKVPVGASEVRFNDGAGAHRDAAARGNGQC